MYRALPLLLLALVLAACGGDDEASAPDTGEPATTAAPEPGDATTTGVDVAATCTNDDLGYTIDYPDGWWANGGDVAPPCSYFNPEPIELPEASEPPPTAARVDVEPVAFERVVGEQLGREILSREDVQVAGRPAARLEFESTGEALLDAGTRLYQYVVDLGGGEVLIATTQEADDLDYERNKQVLDAMVESLELSTG